MSPAIFLEEWGEIESRSASAVSSEVMGLPVLKTQTPCFFTLYLRL